MCIFEHTYVWCLKAWTLKIVYFSVKSEIFFHVVTHLACKQVQFSPASRGNRQYFTDRWSVARRTLLGTLVEESSVHVSKTLSTCSDCASSLYSAIDSKLKVTPSTKPDCMLPINYINSSKQFLKLLIANYFCISLLKQQIFDNDP